MYLAGDVLAAIPGTVVDTLLLVVPLCLFNPNPTPMPTAKPTVTAAIVAVITMTMRDDRRLDDGFARLPVCVEFRFSMVGIASGGESL